MNFEPLQITAFLANGIAVYDDWSPQLESLVIGEIIQQERLAVPNASAEQVKETMAAIAPLIPFEQWEGLYKCSAPVYRYKCEETTKFRKRWEPNGQVNWGKRKPKFSTSEGGEKSYDLPLFLRLTSRIDWFAVGDRQAIENIVSDISGIGKKRSHGYGQIVRWEVTAIAEDWSLVRDGELMKPIPTEGLTMLGLSLSHNIVRWGYKPPAWLPENKLLCVMPEVVRQC
jgi:hypothetical protein